jgi:hypothetical protein
MKRETLTITGVTLNREALNLGNLVVDVSFSSPFLLSPLVRAIVVNSVVGNPRQLPLAGGHYTISVCLSDAEKTYDYHWDVTSFEFPGAALPSANSGQDAMGHIVWPPDWKLP